MNNMSDGVNEVIDNLAEKLGTTAEYLIPELAKYMIATTAAKVIILGTLLIIVVIAIIICEKKDLHDKYGDISGACAALIALLVAGGIMLIRFCTNLTILVGYMSSPTGAVVVELLNDITK